MRRGIAGGFAKCFLAINRETDDCIEAAGGYDIY